MYAELMQREEGIPRHRIRLVIASTHWDELRVAYGAFARFCEYPLMGLELSVDAAGTVQTITDVPDLPLAFRGELGDDYVGLVFADDSARDLGWSRLRKVAPTLGFVDTLGVYLNEAGAGRRLLVLAPGRLDLNLVPTELKANEDEDDEPLDQVVLAELLDVTPDIPRVRSLVWPLSPDRFVGLCQQGWEVASLQREGCFAAASYRSDKELLSAVEGLDGANAVVIKRTVSPEHALDWQEALMRLGHLLDGNDAWRLPALEFLDAHQGARSVDLHVYYLGDILTALRGVVECGDGRWLDEFAVGVDATVALMGKVVWNGSGVGLDEAVEAVVPGGLADVAFRRATGAQLLQPLLMEQLGLAYAVYEVSAAEAPERIHPDGTRCPAQESELASFASFVEQRLDSIVTVVEALRTQEVSTWR